MVFSFQRNGIPLRESNPLIMVDHPASHVAGECEWNGSEAYNKDPYGNGLISAMPEGPDSL